MPSLTTHIVSNKVRKMIDCDLSNFSLGYHFDFCEALCGLVSILLTPCNADAVVGTSRHTIPGSIKSSLDLPLRDDLSPSSTVLMTCPQPSNPTTLRYLQSRLLHTLLRSRRVVHLHQRSRSGPLAVV